MNTPASGTEAATLSTFDIAHGTVLVGDCLDRLRDLPDASIDSIVTDPPYEIGFMGKGWDSTGIAYSVELWTECLRVLKPGGHLLAFGATRSYHRMTVAIEDAGFEIRDSLHWTYGSGFPKSLDVSKAIDKQRHDRADVVKVVRWMTEQKERAGVAGKDFDRAFQTANISQYWFSEHRNPRVPTLDQVATVLDVLGVSFDDVPTDIRRLLWDLNGMAGEPGKNWAKREIVGERRQRGSLNGVAPMNTCQTEVELLTAPATDAAAQWQGWGTALKPSHEPIVLARKPLTGTVAANVLAHGTGALNIDGCRVGTDGGTARDGKADQPNASGWENMRGHGIEQLNAGRWPANTILTHAADCAQTGTRTIKSDGHHPAARGASGDFSGATGGLNGQTGLVERKSGTETVAAWECVEGCPVTALDQQADASRFFSQANWDPQYDHVIYVPKPSRTERNAGTEDLPQKAWKSNKPTAEKNKVDGSDGRPNGNNHPTVKPVALMRHLLRMTTPPGGTVLDPFLGSGTTAVAAELEGANWVGCELTPDYLDIIIGRVLHAAQPAPAPAPAKVKPTVDGEQPPLF